MTSTAQPEQQISTPECPDHGEVSGFLHERWSWLYRSQTGQTLGIALLCTVATWPAVGLAPTTGLDPSWVAGLNMAFVHHIQWGPRMDFTYGPLGFLTQEVLYFGKTAALSMLYLGVVRMATFALLVYWTRKSFGLPLATLVSYVVGATAIALMDGGDLIMVPVTLLAMICVGHQDLGRRRIGIAVVGIAAAVGILAKFSDGVIATVLLVVAVAAGHERREIIIDAAVGMGALLGAIVLLWLATGNALGNLASFFHNSTSISDGYSSAQQIETGRVDEWWYALVVVLVVATFATLSLWRARGRVRMAFIVVLLAVTWWALKEGFVRHDTHDLIFFGLALVLIPVFPIPTSRLRPYMATAIAFLTVIAWTAFGLVPPNLLAVLNDANGLRSQATTILSASSRSSSIDAARNAMQKTYALDPVQFGELTNHTVAIEPWENSVAWAYPSITWDPEPVLQAYQANTATLDQLDASFLRSGNAPDRILDQPPAAIDGGYPFFEPPTTVVTMMCHYTQMSTNPQWQVLQRVHDRCGALRFIKREDVVFGQTVSVPSVPAGDMVVARFVGLPLSLGYKVSSVLLKPPTAAIVTPIGTFRFILGTADDLHLLRTSSSIGFAAPFEPSTIGSFALTGAGVAPGTGRYTVDFYSLPIALH